MINMSGVIFTLCNIKPNQASKEETRGVEITIIVAQQEPNEYSKKFNSDIVLMIHILIMLLNNAVHISVLF